MSTNERRNLTPVPLPPDPEPNKPDDQPSFQDIDEGFIAKLRQFPIEIQEAVARLPSPLRRRLFKNPSASSEHDPSPEHHFFGIPIRRGTLKDLEAMMRESRHANHEWDEEEIEEMNSLERELLSHRVLGALFYQLDVRAMTLARPKQVIELLDTIWRCRTHPQDIVPYRHAYFTELEQQLAELNKAKNDLIVQLNAFGSKKRTRQGKRHLEQLRNQLAEDYGLIWEGVGNIRESDISWGKKGRLIKDVNREIQKRRPELASQKTLALLCEYMDATDFSVIASETLQQHLWTFRRPQPELLSTLSDEISMWHHHHRNEQPLKHTDEPDPSLEQRRVKLIEHFWRLFHSYLQLKQSTNTEPQQLDGTIRYLAVLLHMLK